MCCFDGDAIELQQKYSELQVSDATQKLSCKASYKTPFFFIVILHNNHNRPSTLDTKDVPSSQPKEQMTTKSWELKVGPMVIKGEMKTIR